MKALEKELDRLSQTLEQGFIARNFWLKVIMVFFLYPAATIISGFTEGAHLFINMQNTISSYAISMVFTIFIVAVIEVGQGFAMNGVIDDLREGVVAEGRHHVTSFIVKLVIAAILLAASIGLSIQGAPVANEYFKKKSSPIVLVSIDSINMRYDAQIAEEQATIANASKITWRGKIVEGGQKIITKAQGAKATIEQNRAAEISAAQAENQRRQNDYDGKLEHSGAWFTRFAGIGELIKLICLIFIGNYEAGARTEVKEGDPPTPSRQRSRTPSSGGPIPTGLEERTIVGGFRRRQDDSNRAYPGAHDGHPDTSLSDTPQDQLQPVATDEKTQMRIDYLAMALKNARSNLSAWQSKLSKGEGTRETNERNIYEWNMKILAIEAELITLKG